MEKLIKIICIIAVMTAVIAITAFISHFGFGFASNIGNWGAVGDFFGGVLNPMFALFSLILIAYTLMQNKQALEQSEKAIEQGTKAIEQNEKALQVSNEELRLTRDELANSSNALEEQASLLAIQSFETTFFNMLKLHSRLLDRFNYSYSDSHDAISSELKIPYFQTVSGNLQKHGMFSLNKLLISMKNAHEQVGYNSSIVHIFNAFQLYENKEFGSYFRNLYQVLKLIKMSISNYPAQKKYSNILRAQLSNQELTLLLLNCLCSSVDNGQFKKLVIYFELLEHLDITYSLDTDNVATFTINNPTLNLTSNEIDQYFLTDTNGKLIRSAFGQNSQIMEYCEFRNLLG